MAIVADTIESLDFRANLECMENFLIKSVDQKIGNATKNNFQKSRENFDFVKCVDNTTVSKTLKAKAIFQKEKQTNKIFRIQGDKRESQ